MKVSDCCTHDRKQMIATIVDEPQWHVGCLTLKNSRNVGFILDLLIAIGLDTYVLLQSVTIMPPLDLYGLISR